MSTENLENDRADAIEMICDEIMHGNLRSIEDAEHLNILYPAGTERLNSDPFWLATRLKELMAEINQAVLEQDWTSFLKWAEQEFGIVSPLERIEKLKNLCATIGIQVPESINKEWSGEVLTEATVELGKLFIERRLEIEDWMTKLTEFCSAEQIAACRARLIEAAQENNGLNFFNAVNQTTQLISETIVPRE